MKYLKPILIFSAVVAAAFFGCSDIMARGGGHMGGGGFHGGGGYHGGGWSGGRGEGGHGGEGHHNDNPNHHHNNHNNNNNNNNNNGNTQNNYYGGGDDGWGWGVADGAIAGLAVGAVVANASQPNTVIVEQPAAQPAPAVQPGPAMGTLPAGAQATNVNGVILYESNGVYYRPYFGANGVYYVIVQPSEVKKS